jgi:hypothetical protein
MPQLYNLKAGVSTQADLVTAPDYVAVASADGAITIQSGTVVITKGTAAALTLGTPTAAQNGTVIRIISTTAAAHTVTAATIGFNAADAAGDVGTFAAAIGNGFSCVAYGGEWYVLTNTNVTFA